MNQYPWYAVVNGDVLQQGDILRHCRVFSPPSGLMAGAPAAEDAVVEFQWIERDVIVLSQSCDLEKEHAKVTEVLLCAVWSCDEVGGYLATAKGKEDARRGNLPGYHMLAACDIPGFESEVAVADFRRVHSLPLGHLREFAVAVGDRIRLLPPYREHLAQAFARFFMRVGLPIDIPPFN